MNENRPNFKTIRETAREGILSEYSLRLMCSRGKLPGFYVGRRYMVNVDALIEQLSSMQCGRAV